MALTLSPPLPLELEREIFELCAHSWPSGIPKLMRVAHRVKNWVHPLLYRTLVVYHPLYDDPNDAGPFWITIERVASAISAHPALFSSAARHLFVSLFDDTDVATIGTLLAACTGIEDLFLLVLHHTWISVIALLPLKRFYGPCRGLISIVHPSDIAFLRLTHLKLTDYIPSEAINLWTDFLASLPALTHLAFDDLQAISLCSSLLETCKTLRVLIMLFNFSTQLARRDHTHDALLAQDGRFVCVLYKNYIQDWLMGARWGLDSWKRAEAFIAKRRAGEIDPLQIDVLEDESLAVLA
ncbi:hypothetical protein B0H16DRAFT_1539313 [Mycena metata]|uniref:Uncharacterized protein n=1 Tax=Mycena metata TaxID=1033252 RepID=A0AAD7J3N7_9AGAR|nr:hypothetical protein B0H16DRAFT_1539313 [Mycena metata]